MHFCHSILVEENRPVSIHEEVSNVELVRLWPDTTQCAIQCCLDLLWLGSGQTRLSAPSSAAWTCSGKPSGSGQACTRQGHAAIDGTLSRVWPGPLNLIPQQIRLESQSSQLRPISTAVSAVSHLNVSAQSVAMLEAVAVLLRNLSLLYVLLLNQL